MEKDLQIDIKLPDYVRTGIESFVTELPERLGEKLVSIVLYGGIAKGEYSENSSDVNVIVVLDDVTIDVLDRVVTPVQRAMRDFRLAVLFLSEDNLRSSTDVFPIKFLDMQKYHYVL